ncbi:MAG: hypothetical protein AMK71_03930 [Nitrospira bacterium SG8_35_4]|nr:MAG: hypothetical protein AMK71_03930 [Nitrospira bacterium SG8_35_4]
MNFIRLLPVTVSLVLLGAHYYRAGFTPLVAIMGTGVLILLARQPWAARIVQVLLIIGGIEWVRTAFNLVMARQSMGTPWIRLSLILAGVALLAIGSLFIFRTGSVRRRYKLD